MEKTHLPILTYSVLLPPNPTMLAQFSVKVKLSNEYGTISSQIIKELKCFSPSLCKNQVVENVMKAKKKKKKKKRGRKKSASQKGLWGGDS